MIITLKTIKIIYKMNLTLKQKIGIALIFSISMAFLESAVVVYLRYLFFADGFVMPEGAMRTTVVITELGREAATIIMLAAAGYMLAATKLSRLAWFLFCFAVWDIFYYVFLYVLLHWPASIFDWDILFLIPVAWYGPVITPCLVSATLIGLSLIIVGYEHKGAVRRMRKREWGSILIACGAILYTFISPFFQNNIYLGKAQQTGTVQNIVAAGLSHYPSQYNWLLFFTALLAFWATIIVYWRRVHNSNQILY
jgi:hypothetical protein